MDYIFTVLLLTINRKIKLFNWSYHYTVANYGIVFCYIRATNIGTDQNCYPKDNGLHWPNIMARSRELAFAIRYDIEDVDALMDLIKMAGI